MSTMTPSVLMRAFEDLSDAYQQKQDDEQHFAEERARLINARADEINLTRFKSLSDEDMALALEMLSTYPMCIKGIKREMLEHGESFALIFETYVMAALLSDSIRQAREEFSSLDAIKTGEVH